MLFAMAFIIWAFGKQQGAMPDIIKEHNRKFNEILKAAGAK
jgi:hypothetical protein